MSKELSKLYDLHEVVEYSVHYSNYCNTELPSKDSIFQQQMLKMHIIDNDLLEDITKLFVWSLIKDQNIKDTLTCLLSIHFDIADNENSSAIANTSSMTKNKQLYYQEQLSIILGQLTVSHLEDTDDISNLGEGSMLDLHDISSDEE